ncbi:MAG: hypothetical protein ABWY09_01700, partial [Stenotrophomonas maltophilia]
PGFASAQLSPILGLGQAGQQAGEAAAHKKNAPDPSIRGVLVFHGAEGGTRTHTLLRAADFESEQESLRHNGFVTISAPQTTIY